jgi:hypothetical protein
MAMSSRDKAQPRAWMLRQGDTEAIRALRIAAGSRARCVLVVEKDSVFRKLIADRFTERLPSVLITACGYPDLATRALVAKVVDALRVRAFALTDHNPHVRPQPPWSPAAPVGHRSPPPAQPPPSDAQ